MRKGALLEDAIILKSKMSTPQPSPHDELTQLIALHLAKGAAHTSRGGGFGHPHPGDGPSPAPLGMTGDDSWWG